MRQFLFAMIAIAGIGFATNAASAAPASAPVINSAAEALGVIHEVDCRRYYHCHSWGCHYGCRRVRVAPRAYYYTPRAYRHYSRPVRPYYRRHRW